MERENPLIDYSSRQKRPKLYTRSIDRREIMRRNELMDYPQSSGPKLPNPLRHNISDLYPDNRELFQRNGSRRYNAMATQMCDATLPRSYLASHSRNYHPLGQHYAMTPTIETSPNSVFRSKHGREDTWLV